jgi:hypothetical protein
LKIRTAVLVAALAVVGVPAGALAGEAQTGQSRTRAMCGRRRHPAAFGRRWSRLLLAATLAVVPALIIEWDASGGWHRAAVIANWVIWSVFAIEFALQWAEGLKRSSTTQRQDLPLD